MNTAQERKDLNKRIIQAQQELRLIDPKSQLLEMVTVDVDETSWTEEFGIRYHDRSVFDSLNRYVSDLKEAYANK